MGGVRDVSRGATESLSKVHGVCPLCPGTPEGGVRGESDGERQGGERRTTGGCVSRESGG